MSDDTQDSLDKLLGAWSASREADGKQIRELSDKILAAVREQTEDVVDASSGDEPLGDRPVPARLHAQPMPLANSDVIMRIVGGWGSAPCHISAAAYDGVSAPRSPASNWVSSEPSASDIGAALAMPKSRILMRLSLVRKTLPGLKSEWMMFLLCA